MITEVIPKAQVLPISPALLHIEGHVLFTNFDLAQPNLGTLITKHLHLYEGFIDLQRSDIWCSIPFEHLWISVNLMHS